MKTALGYTRLSQQSDTSIARQKEHIRTYCDRRGLRLETILDEGERQSGFDSEREKFQRVRERVRTGDIDVVVVNDTRRLARDVDDVMELVPQFRRNGVELHTWQDGRLDLSDPMRAAIEIVQAASEHESKQKEIERAREAVKERQANGYWQGSPRFGTEFDDAGQHLVPGERWDDVMTILELREDGATYEAIADEVDANKATCYRVWQRRDWYRNLA